MKTTIISAVLSILIGATGAGVSAQTGTPGAERFVLTGMVAWSGNEGVAWLQEPDLTRNEMVAVRIGERVGPWKLTRFLDNGVELDGPTGKILVPLQNVGAGGTVLAAGESAGPAPAATSTARTIPRDDASPAATPAPFNPAPGNAWEPNRPTPNAGGFSEALSKARAARAERPSENAQDQPREAGSAGSQTGRGATTPVAATSPGGTNDAAGGATNVIQFPVGGGRQGVRELFGSR